MDILERAIKRIEKKVERAKYNYDQSVKNGWDHAARDKEKFEEYDYILKVLRLHERGRKL